MGILIVQRLDQDLARIEVDDRPALVVLRVLHIFFAFGQLDFLLPPGFSDVHPEGGKDDLEVLLCCVQIPEQGVGIARILVETFLGDLCRIFSLGEINDGLAGPAPHDALSRREGSVGRLTG